MKKQKKKTSTDNAVKYSLEQGFPTSGSPPPVGPRRVGWGATRPWQT